MENTRQSLRAGLIDGLPFILVIMPFGTLYGVVASEAGMTVLEAVAMSVLVIAGAAQFAATQLMVEQAPNIIAIATGLAVNMRMLMYSASLAVYLGSAPLWQRALLAYPMVDQVFAAAMLRYETHPEMTIQQRVLYYFGVLLPIYPIWIISTWAGAKFGASIPASWGLDFAIPITFLALVGPALRSLAHVVAACVSVAVALMLHELPYNAGMMIAAICAVCAGALTEIWSARHAGS